MWPLGPAAEVAGGGIPTPRGASESSTASSESLGAPAKVCGPGWGGFWGFLRLETSLSETRAVSAPGASSSLVSDPVPDSAIPGLQEHSALFPQDAELCTTTAFSVQAQTGAGLISAGLLGYINACSIDCF